MNTPIPDALEFGPMTLHQPLEGDIPPESVKVFMPAPDGGIECIGFLYTDSSMDGWAASQNLRETLRAGKLGTVDDLASLKQHLQALYQTRGATNRRLTGSINIVYDRAHELETQARQAGNTRIRDCLFNLKLCLDSCRAILELGPDEEEIRR